MTEALRAQTVPLLLVGATVVLATLARAGLTRVGVPAMVGYLLIGFGLSAADAGLGLLAPAGRQGFELLAEAGVVALLFRVGLESHPAKLLRMLPRAGGALVGDVAVSAVLGWLAARSVLGLAPIPALFAAVALTATSVAVSVDVWREAGMLDSGRGALLLDLGELDDIAAILLMTLLVRLTPALAGDGDQVRLDALALGALWLLARLALLVALCLLFARYAEERLTGWFGRLVPSAELMLLVAGTGFVVAALAGWLGFSPAIGALFAGLAFSRDPQRVRIDRAFGVLFALFAPFFFVGIGLALEPGALVAGLGLGGLLLVAAVAGKVLGAGLPVAATAGWGAGLLIGPSMMPRAEITLLVMREGRGLGPWAVPSELFAAMTVVSLATCLGTPLAVRALLARVAGRKAGQP